MLPCALFQIEGHVERDNPVAIDIEINLIHQYFYVSVIGFLYNQIMTLSIQLAELHPVYLFPSLMPGKQRHQAGSHRFYLFIRYLIN